MKIENPPEVNNLVLYVYTRITDEFNVKFINESKYNHKKLNDIQEKQISKQKLQYSNNLENTIW